jgi:hypothetical protein
MCKYASFVLTKDKTFWSNKTESHEEIIREFDLCETDSTKTRINILRVECSPDKCWGDLSKWIYKVDQDIRPEWFEPQECEARTRKALKEKIGKKLLKNFKLLDEFLTEINTTKWLKQHGKIKKEWKYFEGITWDASWDSAGDAAWDAAWDAAGDAAWDAAWDAARGAVRAAAWDAAGDAARGAVRAAAGDAAGGSAWDAALMARYVICTDLKIDPKHIKHVNDRWEVWKRGYALLCDINGVLYVYGVKK